MTTPPTRASPTLRSLLTGLDGVDPDALDLTIHPGDAMYGFAAEQVGGVREQARLEYFRSGHNVWQVVDAALRQILGPRWPKRRPARVLDFGAGHGRVTRFLLPQLGASRLTSTEADPSAVEFLRAHFGLAAHQTPSDPSGVDLRHRFEQPEGFDAILALSVLTHLPEPAFEAWLKRWLDALTVEGGVLLFTTLGPATLLPGRSMPRSGFHFERISESRILDLDEYGTAWVTRDRVGRTLDRLTRGLARWKHVPRGVWNLQDLWLVTLDPRVHWGGDFELAVDLPTGQLEACRADGSILVASGWATGGRRPPRPARVELLLDGELVAEMETSGHRADAIEHLDLEEGAQVAAGFELRHRSNVPIDPATQVRIEVVDDVDPARSNGRRHVLHAGSVEGTELFLQMRGMLRDADHYRNQVEIFEQSRWGKMRRIWMSWKRRLRP
ncbi:MAG: class I SAM-dependent methyltransferase [Thermoanaerobaculia bacterium]|nr:class I SAM-dependent methyltransferase [Thermoanaerobaculia bacterium]